MAKRDGGGLPPISERQIRRLIKDYLEAHGWCVIYHLQGLGSFRGLADMQALKMGRCIFIELKTKTGRLSEVQMEFQRMVECAGIEYVVVRDIDDVRHLCVVGK